MADISITKEDVAILNPQSAILHRLPASAVTILAGDLVRFDTTTGKLVHADGSNAAGAKVLGIALESPQYVGETITVCERGQVSLGTAFDSATLDAPVYLSDTDTAGNMTFTALESTVTKIIGRVFPLFSGGTLKKILDINCMQKQW